MDKLGKSNYVYFEEVNQSIIKYVGNNLKILDVGCGFGTLGNEIKKRNNIVYGIDLSDHAISKAQNRIDKAFVTDATKVDNLPSEIAEGNFDLIIFADILEHVYNPFKLLKDYKQFLKTEGYIIASIPNIATWNVRLSLLFGIFNYQDTGTLDRTHIRFFTKKSATSLIINAGYKIEKTDITPNFIRPFVPWIKKILAKSENGAINPRAIIDSAQYKFYLKRILAIETFIAKLWRNMFAFQFIFVAKPVTNRGK